MAEVDDKIQAARAALNKIMAEQHAATEKAFEEWIKRMKDATTYLSDLLQSPEARDNKRFDSERPLVDNANKQIAAAEIALATKVQKTEAASSVTTTPAKSEGDKTCTFSKEKEGYKIAGGDQAMIRSKIEELAHDKKHNYHITKTNLADGGRRYNLFYDKEHKKPLNEKDRKDFMDELFKTTKTPLENKEYKVVNAMDKPSSDETKRNVGENTKPSTAPTPKPTPSGMK